MDTKMIFFDIDGTLLPEGSRTIPESTRLALKKAKEKGHLIFINTGRTWFSIENYIRDLDFDGYVCGCGTYIYFKNQCLLANSLSRATCLEIMEKMREYKIPGFFESNEFLCMDTKTPVKCTFLDDFKERTKKIGIVLPDFFSDENYTFDKILIHLEPDSDVEAFKKYIDSFMTYIDRGDNIAEIIQKDFSKATGIEFLCDYLDIPLENCYAVGDSTNDLSMLSYVPNSIAMGNSMTEILPYCSYQTTDIMEDGVYNALKHYGLID